MKLSTNQVYARLKTTDFSGFQKPGKNKGERGQLLETALGVANSSNLTDLVDGEIKSYTVGQTIAVTQVKHCLLILLTELLSLKIAKLVKNLHKRIRRFH